MHDVRHSYATAALKAGIPPKIISERLGHSTAAFTMQTYAHVIPGMDKRAAVDVADLILRGGHTDEAAVRTSVRTSVRTRAAEPPQESEETADLERFRRSAGSSIRSGGRI